MESPHPKNETKRLLCELVDRLTTAQANWNVYFNVSSDF